MYSYLKGKIISCDSEMVVIDVNNVGYYFKTPNPFYFTVNTEILVYTHLHVREDIFELYGFKAVEERKLFLKLISVKGIGPKSALAVLASGSVSEIAQAIERSDDKYLTRFPGIGPKAAMQIVLDLKGKIAFDDESNNVNEYVDVVEALISLGYKRNIVEKIVSSLDSGLTESEAIKEALQQL